MAEEEQQELAFKVSDRLGREVQLRSEVYERHLPTHPEIADYLAEAAKTIADPDYELEDDDGSIVYYRKGLGRGKFKGCFIKVPVHYRKTFWGEAGEVATFHLTGRLGRGRVIWSRPTS